MDVNRLSYEDALARKLSFTPAVVILGARQIGKTTLAQNYAKATGESYQYFDLENPEDREKIGDNPVSFFDYFKDQLVILDEVQVMPELYNALRSIIDKDKRFGRFILLGSVSPQLVAGVSESLAGRISFLDLSQFTLSEVSGDFDQQSHWIKGGFPIPFLSKTTEQSFDWMESFIRTYVERDLNILFDRSFNPVLSRRLWNMLANQQGALLNLNNLSKSLGVTAPVVKTYIEYMEGAFLIHRLLPWHNNKNKRLVKSPKIYIRDTGILHYFHKIKTYDELHVDPIIGASWESYVFEQVLFHKPSNTELYFYRTHNQAEIDLMLIENGKPIIAMEIKLSNSPSLSRGFYTSCEDLGIEKRYVITPHSDTYPKANGVMVINIKEFLKILKE